MSAKRRRLNIIIVAVSISIAGIILLDVFLSNVLEDLGLTRFVFAIFLLINIGRLMFKNVEKNIAASVVFNVAIIIFSIVIFFNLALASFGYGYSGTKMPWAIDVIPLLIIVLFVLGIVDMVVESEKKHEIN